LESFFVDHFIVRVIYFRRIWHVGYIDRVVLLSKHLDAYELNSRENQVDHE